MKSISTYRVARISEDDIAIRIPYMDWLEIKQCLAKLQALEEHGVDNWSGYGEAMLALDNGEAS